MEDQIICPECQTQNPPNHIFCQECGTRLLDEEGDSFFEDTTEPETGTSFFSDESEVPATPPPVVVRPPRLTASGLTRIDRLGDRLDGWGDLIEGAAEKTDEFIDAFDRILDERNMPDVTISREDVTPGGLIGKQRTYHIVRDYLGITLAVYIGEFGEDVYAAWDMFYSPRVKWLNILVMLGIDLILSFFSGYFSPTRLFAGMAGFSTSDFGYSMGPTELCLVCCPALFLWAIPIVIVAMILGKILYNNVWSMFIEHIDQFAADDAAAVGLAVHKTMLRAVDEIGLKSSLLREKEQFAGGRKRRLI